MERGKKITQTKTIAMLLLIAIATVGGFSTVFDFRCQRNLPAAATVVVTAISTVTIIATATGPYLVGW